VLSKNNKLADSGGALYPAEAKRRLNLPTRSEVVLHAAGQAASAGRIRAVGISVLQGGEDVKGLRRFHDAQLDVQAGRDRHVDQGVQAKEMDLSTQQIGDARLRDAEQLGGLALAQASSVEVILERHHQRRAELHVLRFGRCVLDRIPYAVKSFIVHGLPVVRVAPEVGVKF